MTTTTSTPFRAQAGAVTIGLAFIATAISAVVPGLSIVVAVAFSTTVLRGNRTARVLLIVFGVVLLLLPPGLLLGTNSSTVGPAQVAQY